MPLGTCDPASRGETFNEGELAIEQSEAFPRGAVTLSYRYGWDGPRTITGVSRVNGSPTLNAPAGSFNDSDAGRAVTGTGIPGGTTIAAYVSGTRVTLSANATSTGTNGATIAGSTFATGCVGPLLRIRLVNNTPDTFYGHFKGRRGNWRRVTLNPNESRNIGQTALTAAGFIDNTDLEGLYITRDPNPPADQRSPR